ncbi:MAG: hypothetical protein C0504_12835 [Candidatus Solibacter sp.]|nr:hypothetical protein [Candidatus Solibacter sp.]
MNSRTVLCVLLIAAAVLAFCPGVQAAQPSGAGKPATAAEAAAELWTFMLPDAKIVAGIDWQRAKSSPAGQMISKRLVNAPATRGKVASAGLDFVDGFDRLLMSAPAPAPGQPGTQQMLLALSGRFDRARLKKSMPAGTAIERFQGIDLFIPPSSKTDEMVAGFVSDRLLLLGDKASIAGALQTRSGLSDAALLDRAKQMEASHEIWMIADSIPEMPAASGASPIQGMEDIRAAEIGIALRSGMDMTAILTFTDAEKAQGMAMFAQMLAAMPAGNNPASREMAAMARNLSVKAEGASVKATLSLSMAQLASAAVQMRGGIEQASRKTLESLVGVGSQTGPIPGLRPAARATPSQPLASAPRIAPPRPAQPVKKTIRIVGLDDGDKEISYSSPGGRH